MLFEIKKNKIVKRADRMIKKLKTGRKKRTFDRNWTMVGHFANSLQNGMRYTTATFLEWRVLNASKAAMQVRKAPVSMAAPGNKIGAFADVK